MSPPQTALLAGIVAVAFLVEAAAGFGSMVVALTVGALFFPMPSLLGWLVPVNLKPFADNLPAERCVRLNRLRATSAEAPAARRCRR